MKKQLEIESHIKYLYYVSIFFRHDIAEILLRVALNTINQPIYFVVLYSVILVCGNNVYFLQFCRLKNKHYFN